MIVGAATPEQAPAQGPGDPGMEKPAQRLLTGRVESDLQRENTGESIEIGLRWDNGRR
jgi:hypothetical protein